MKTLRILSLISILSYTSTASTDSLFINQMFDMESILSNFNKAMDEAWAQMPSVLNASSSQIPLDINYDDSSNVIISINFTKDSLKEAEAEALEKRNLISIMVKLDDGNVTLNIDRRGINITSEKHVETKTVDEEEKKSSHTSYSSQNYYQNFHVPVEAANAQVAIEDDKLIITLPREKKVKKVKITRKTKETQPNILNIKE